MFNQKNISKTIALSLGVLVMSFLVGYLVFAQVWQEPTAAPPGNNVDAPINVGIIDQDKTGWLTFEGGGTRNSTFLATLGGNVGIGTTVPGTIKLNVAGTIKGNYTAEGTSCTGSQILKRNSAGNAWTCASDQMGDYTYNFFRPDADGVRNCLSECQAICSNGKVTYCALEQWYNHYSSTNGTCTGRIIDVEQTTVMSISLNPGPVNASCIGATPSSWDWRESIRRVTGVCVCPL